MLIPRALICATLIIFGVCSANISFDHLRLNIFDNNQTHLVESLVPISFKSTETFFANKNIAKLIANTETSTLTSVIPFVGQLGSLSLALRNLVAKDGDWMQSFVKTISNENRSDLALNEIHWMQAAIDLIQSEVIDLDGTNADHDVFRKRIASFMYSDFDEMINIFAHQYSIFKKFPLIGAPVLIELSLLIAIFTPIAKILVPLEVQNPQIACKTLNTLLDYRPRTVSARLEKIHSNSTLFVGTLAAVRQLPYNPYGYHKTMSSLQCQRVDENRPFSPSNNSLWDEFGYYIPQHYDQLCFSDYASLVRHKVEELFPIELLEKVCNRKSSFRTNYGWLTIQIRNVRAYGLADGSSCDVSSTSLCDPYVKLFINNEAVIETKPQENECCLDANITYQSIKIPKKSTIKIEVWDDDSGFFGSADDLVQSTEGSVDSFLKTPLRAGAIFSANQNLIETIAFWQDELQ